MSDMDMNACTKRCWQMAAIGGAVIWLLLWLAGGWSFVASLLVGLVLAGIAGVALRMFLCTGQAATGTTAQGSGARPAPSEAPATSPAASSAAAASATAEAPVASEPAAAPPQDAPATQPKPAPAADAGGAVKPSKALAGQAELASRKGSWKYEKGGPGPGAAQSGTPGASQAAAQPDAAPAGEPVSPASQAEATPTAAAGPGTKPATLSSAREGGPDNLKLIKGVGPKLEALLNSMGFYHFDQVAHWGPEEVAWVDQNLKGFKGRVSRDNWVEQAKILAAGGETEFSAKSRS